ncbi:MAG: Gfo/Idh/MocA family oxidoreductase [Spirochaetales bacterium]|nr:Gfo/Idh/MocA family oxidoreductase [Spirochaetales bacterium]
MLKIGIIGAGYFGSMHASAIADTEGIHLSAVSRRNKNTLEQFKKKYGVKIYTDWHNLIKDPEIDTVVIATPHYLHTEIAVQTVAAGKNILLEKPIAPTMEECRIISRVVKNAAKNDRIKFMAGYINHFAKAYRAAREVISAGEIGQIVAGSSVMYKLWMQENRRPWHLERKTGGGLWLTAGMHCLDRLTWLFNEKIESVSARLGTAFHKQQADDYELMFLRYSGGLTGTITSIGYRTGVERIETEIIGTKGIMKIDMVKGVSIGRNEHWVLVPDTGSNNAMHEALINEWESFRDVIEKGGINSVPIDYAVHIMEGVFAAEKSSLEKKEIILSGEK